MSICLVRYVLHSCIKITLNPQGSAFTISEHLVSAASRQENNIQPPGGSAFTISEHLVSAASRQENNIQPPGFGLHHI